MSIVVFLFLIIDINLWCKKNQKEKQIKELEEKLKKEKLKIKF